MNEGHLPIGRFARLCRLSVKQLRHYDELGLLAPAHVDPDSGYRYYRPDQARAALLIGLLRSLDVPLPSIGRVLSDGTGALGGVRDRMEADLARRERNFAALERILSRGLPHAEVTVVREPARQVATVRDTATLERIGAVTSAGVARLMTAVNAVGALRTAGAVASAGIAGGPEGTAGDTGGPVNAAGGPTGSPIGLFPLDLTGEIAVTIAVETSADVPGTSPDVLPGGLYASVTHVGPYDQISLTTHALLAWLGERGHTPDGPLREVYVSDPRTTSPDRLVTHLMIKLEDPG
ncbi:GyrI-like domain-containing protein [Streptosporangium sp. NPDC048047]|uniref:MerR family transcriptional regulator n=1 Tax=Streptosporangium sp. NPDC048047 TaxID=3155748 RepID=UPI00341D0C2D